LQCRISHNLSMARTTPFEIYHHRYDDWFVRHAVAYQSELLAVRALLPWQGLGLSIGVGTGRFAAPMGIQVGIDPAHEVLAYAAKRGVATVQAIAEALPFADCSFDYALSVTTICFVDNINVMLKEAFRVLKPGGVLVIGFIDRNSNLGQHYLAHQAENVFYKEATFYSADEVERLLYNAGFSKPVWVQTLSRNLEEIDEIEPLYHGYGRGAFVVVKVSRL
jgi:ubiquinone/menaquinone biosynthesis C-methylase UbiE